MLSLPIWVYLVILGIFSSAFMALKTAKEDKEIETEWIEKEGQVYIDRMEQEKERRGRVSVSEE
ncbi:sporulation YhaL family protein [Lederbergia wuyishanensis]|nr:sporulation YhaL family protein [Lederbergia wuyishanensis]